MRSRDVVEICTVAPEFGWSESPTRAGWYAILRSYDELDVTESGAAYWTGREWSGRQSGPITACCGPMRNCNRAAWWAKLNHPDKYRDVDDWNKPKLEETGFDMSKFPLTTSVWR